MSAIFAHKLITIGNKDDHKYTDISASEEIDRVMQICRFIGRDLTPSRYRFASKNLSREYENRYLAIHYSSAEGSRIISSKWRKRWWWGGGGGERGGGGRMFH